MPNEQIMDGILHNPENYNVRSGLTYLHRFRSQVTGLTVCNGRLIACTERGVYILQKNGKRWRKVKPPRGKL